MRKRYKILIFAGLVLTASAIECCIHFHQIAKLAAAYAACPESYMIETANRIDYQSGMECAAMSSAYVLRHYGEEADGIELYKDFPGKMENGGVPPGGIEEFFSERKYDATLKLADSMDEVKYEISKGNPVIVFIHGEEPYTDVHNTHYVPMIGYDEEYVYLADSVEDFANCTENSVPYNRRETYEKFDRLWKNIDGLWDNPYFVIQPMK